MKELEDSKIDWRGERSYTELSPAEKKTAIKEVKSLTNHLLDIGCKITGEKMTDLMSRSRKRTLVDMRTAIANICRRYGVVNLGNCLKRDHSDISHYFKTHEAIFPNERRYKALYLALKTNDLSDVTISYIRQMYNVERMTFQCVSNKRGGGRCTLMIYQEGGMCHNHIKHKV